MKVADLLELADLFVLEEGAKELLKNLKPRYELGLISNWDESLTDILLNLGILNFFESITISGDIGVSKPDSDIFRSALEDFPDIKPKESVYIGDDYFTDIIPALQMNMFAIFFDKGPSGMHGRPFQTEVKCIRINDLSELPKILNKYSNEYFGLIFSPSSVWAKASSIRPSMIYATLKKACPKLIPDTDSTFSPRLRISLLTGIISS